jgi:Holliday junction resolvase RusA-like endonuclease
VSASFYLGNARRVDCDNLWKNIGDALEGIAWRDDADIVGLSLHKEFSSPTPRTVVTIEPVRSRVEESYE